MDGASKGGAGAVGGLLRDHNGEFIWGFFAPYQIADPQEAKIRALNDGLERCVEQGRTRLCVERMLL